VTQLAGCQPADRFLPINAAAPTGKLPVCRDNLEGTFHPRGESCSVSQPR
jgi:hypothetical protein